jgi:hypothetical protein
LSFTPLKIFKTSESKTRPKDPDLPPGIDADRGLAGEWTEMQEWWEELVDKLSRGQVMEIPKDMTTEILFKTGEEINDRVGRDLGDNLIWSVHNGVYGGGIPTNLRTF